MPEATPTPPRPRRPHVVSAHGDDREDPWYWLRDRDDPAVLAYLEAENAYTDAETAPLAGLARRPLRGDEGPDQGDRHVGPGPSGPWWYYSRTEEGKNYASTAGGPPAAPDELPPPASRGATSRSCSTRTTLAEGSDYFAVGTAAVSHDHRWLAYGTDVAGNERYELRFRPLDAGIARPDPARPPSRCPRSGYGLAWSDAGPTTSSTSASTRPSGPSSSGATGSGTGPRRATSWSSRRPTGGSRSAPGRRVTAPSSSSGLHSTNTTRVAGHPHRRRRWPHPTVVLAQRPGVEYAVDHLRPARGRRGWFVALTNDGALDFRVLAAPDDAARRSGAWREIVAHRPGVRVEDVDAFSSALVLSERAEAQTRVRVLPLRGGPDPFGGGPARPAGSSPPPRARRRPGSGPTPSPTPPSLRIGRTSLVTPIERAADRPRRPRARRCSSRSRCWATSTRPAT